MTSYDEDSIQILPPKQIAGFLFNQKSALMKRYAATSPVFINRLVDAAMVVGECLSKVEQRYLKKDKSVQVSQEFLSAYRESVSECRYE